MPAGPGYTTLYPAHVHLIPFTIAHYLIKLFQSDINSQISFSLLILLLFTYSFYKVIS